MERVVIESYCLVAWFNSGVLLVDLNDEILFLLSVLPASNQFTNSLCFYGVFLSCVVGKYDMMEDFWKTFEGGRGESEKC